MSARDEIFAGIRRSLHVGGAEAPRRAAVADRLARAPSGVIPARGKGGVATFKEEAARASATLTQVAAAAEIPSEIARYLREHNLPAILRIGADTRLSALPWDETALELSHGPSDATILTPPVSPTRPSPRPARWRSPPGSTIPQR